MSEFGFYLYLKPGCKREEIEVIPLSQRVPTYDQWKSSVREDLWLSMISFGPKGLLTATFDDEGLLKSDPIPTVEINRHILHGPVTIWRTVMNDEGEPTSGGLTQADVTLLKAKLNLLNGDRKYQVDIDKTSIEVVGFDNIDDLFAASSERKRFVERENQNRWGEE